MLYARSGREEAEQVPDPREVTVAVGRNVRAERLRKTWTLDDLAARSGISKGMLVQVEQARTNPSIATICRLATALGVSMASLVEAPEAPSAQVVRAGEGVPLWRGRAGGLAKLMAGVGTRHQVELWDVRIVAGDAMVSEAHPAGTRPATPASPSYASPWRWWSSRSPTATGPASATTTAPGNGLDLRSPPG